MNAKDYVGWYLSFVEPMSFCKTTYFQIINILAIELFENSHIYDIK